MALSPEALLSPAVSLLAPPLCWGCGATAGEREPLCSGCRTRLRRLDPEPAKVGGVRVWAAFAYEGPARALVRGLKFRGALRLAETLAAQIVASAPPRLLEGGVLVPVPLHRARLRRRGFNQAERLAAALAHRTGFRVADCLERSGPDRTQVGRPRNDRLAGLTGQVHARPGALVPGHALLVDDVVTTGATLAACAAALRAAGSRRVGAIAYARTPGR